MPTPDTSETQHKIILNAILYHVVLKAEIVNPARPRPRLRAAFLTPPRAGERDAPQGTHRHRSVEMPLSFVLFNVAAVVD